MNCSKHYRYRPDEDDDAPWTCECSEPDVMRWDECARCRRPFFTPEYLKELAEGAGK